MALKVFRAFFGGYNPDLSKMIERKHIVIPQFGRKIITVLEVNQGFGIVRGKTLKQGKNYSPVPVCIFRKDNRQLLWETKSKLDGSYSFRNIVVGLNCFVVAFDPNNQYNAVIQDNVVAIDGRIS